MGIEEGDRYWNKKYKEDVSAAQQETSGWRRWREGRRKKIVFVLNTWEKRTFLQEQ